MARNEEKQYCRLNRILLHQEKEEFKKNNPKRPRLDTLTSAREIKQWIPSIKKDLEFCLKQSQVPCYPESKIAEFQSDIQKLECEFKAFVRKTKQLEPQSHGIPWTNRPYKSQSENDCDNTTKATGSTTGNEPFVQIRTPILDQALSATEHKTVPEINHVNIELIDKPLVFGAQISEDSLAVEKTKDIKAVSCDDDTELRKCSKDTRDKYLQQKRNYSLCANASATSNEKQNSLPGLDYSSSDSDN